MYIYIYIYIYIYMYIYIYTRLYKLSTENKEIIIIIKAFIES